MATKSKRVSIFERLSKSTTYATRDRKNVKPKPPTGIKDRTTEKVSEVRKVVTRPNSHVSQLVKGSPKNRPDRVIRKKSDARKTEKITTQPRAQKVERRSITQPRIKTKSTEVRKNENKSGAQKVTPGGKTKNGSALERAGGKLDKKSGKELIPKLGISMRGLSIGPVHFSDGNVDELLDFDDDDMSFNDETSDKAAQKDSEALCGNDNGIEMRESACVGETIEEEQASIPHDDENRNEDMRAHEQSIDVTISEEVPMEEYLSPSPPSNDGSPETPPPVPREEPTTEILSTSEPQRL